MNFSVEVGKRLAQIGVQFSHAGLVRRRARLRRVIDEVVREQLVEHVEVPPALHLLGVAPHDGLGLFRNRSHAHRLLFVRNLWREDESIEGLLPTVISRSLRPLQGLYSAKTPSPLNRQRSLPSANS